MGEMEWETQNEKWNQRWNGRDRMRNGKSEMEWEIECERWNETDIYMETQCEKNFEQTDENPTLALHSLICFGN